MDYEPMCKIPRIKREYDFILHVMSPNDLTRVKKRIEEEFYGKDFIAYIKKNELTFEINTRTSNICGCDNIFHKIRSICPKKEKMSVIFECCCGRSNYRCVDYNHYDCDGGEYCEKCEDCNLSDCEC